MPHSTDNVVDQSCPSNLPHLFGRFKLSSEDDAVELDESPELRALHLADFEMARLKEIKEARLLQWYLKLEKYLPTELSFLTAQSLRFIVKKYRLSIGANRFSLSLVLGRLGLVSSKPVSLILRSLYWAILS